MEDIRPKGKSHYQFNFFKDTSFIRISKLRAFLTALGSPMGFDGNICDDRDKQDQFIASLDLPTYNDFSEYQ
jgi:hypothetical protein